MMKKLNKYVITLLVAAVVFLVIGEQSVIRQIHRGHQIHQIERQIAEMEADIDYSRRTLDVLQNTDSLERFARETYYMHKAGEDVFVVKN